MDIVATATGKIVPTGRSKVIQPFETGVVRAIRVADGQTVSAGDVLIELDPTINQGETDHLRGDLQSAQLDIARLRAALADTDDPLAAFHPPEDADPELVAMQRQFLVAQIAEHKAKIAALDGQRTRSRPSSPPSRPPSPSSRRSFRPSRSASTSARRSTNTARACNISRCCSN